MMTVGIFDNAISKITCTSAKVELAQELQQLVLMMGLVFFFFSLTHIRFHIHAFTLRALTKLKKPNFDCSYHNRAFLDFVL